MPALTSLWLDAPAEHEGVAGWVRVQGWCSIEGQPEVPRFYVDDRPAEVAVWADHRPDVCRVNALPENLYYGFSGWVNLGDVHREVTLSVRADGPDGVLRWDTPLDARPGGVVVQVDRPGPYELAQDVVEVEGWAYGRAAPLVGVRITGPHGTDVRAGYGRARHDVPADGASAPAARSGFEARVALPEALMHSAFSVAVVAEDAEGRVGVAPLVIRRATAGQAAVSVDRVDVRAGRMEIEGFVAWPSPAPPDPRIEVEVDGRVVATAPADRWRPDVVRRLPARASTGVCGFAVAAPVGEAAVVRLTARSADGRVATTDVPLAGGRAPRSGTAVPVPPADALRRHVRSGSTVLDWGTGIDADGAWLTVFSPAVDGAELPYLDDSVDFVVVPPAAAARRAEALRVASRAVLEPSADGERYEVTPVPGAPAPRPRPSVSIVIPVYGQDDVTDGCLRAILTDDVADLDLEVIVVDDASPGPTAAFLEGWHARDPRVRPLVLEANHGYLRAVNRGVSEARGDVIVLLNNDTEPVGGWLDALLDLLEDRPSAGIVGSKLVYPDGSLQDAGGLIFRDGHGWNFGRGATDPEAPEYSFVRRVDYCSAAALATPRRVWEEVGGFDEQFAPAYYEDTDYAMAVRAAGYDVLVQPASVVVHHEGKSHGTDLTTGGKAHQVANRHKFAEKWRDALASHPRDPNAVTPTSLREMLMLGRER